VPAGIVKVTDAIVPARGKSVLTNESNHSVTTVGGWEVISNPTSPRSVCDQLVSLSLLCEPLRAYVYFPDIHPPVSFQEPSP
jgi:hypothetical protein